MMVLSTTLREHEWDGEGGGRQDEEELMEVDEGDLEREELMEVAQGQG